MRLAVLLAAVAMLVVGCGGEPGSGHTETVITTPAPADATEPQDVPAGAAGLANCEELPELRSQLEGKLSGRQNPDHIVEGVLATYAMEHPDTFGGRWIDRDSGGVLMMGFTDDPEPHRAAILARRPSVDDYPAVDPRPPITDDRPLGERDDVVIDVLQVRFSAPEVEAMLDELMEAMPIEDWRGFGLDGSGYDIHRQRATLYLVNPPQGALDEVAARVPDPSALCVEITRTPQPPSGPLDVIPNLDVEDPLVSCPDTPAVSGEASGRPCEPAVRLPPGLARVEVHLDINSMPDAADTSVDLLVTEQGCANGRDMGDALRGPQVIETDEAVVVAFAVVPIAGMATCPGNPSTSVTIELSEPLGRRWVYDGLFLPPAPLVAVTDPLTSTDFRDTFTCRAGSALAARNQSDAAASGTGLDAFETANRVLLNHLGDLSEPLYDIEVAERGLRHERWRVAVEDSNGEAHFGTVQAGLTTEGLWRIEQTRWCLTSAGNSDTVRLSVTWKQQQLQPPADLSECPMISDREYDAAEPPEEGLPTPGAVLRENLNPLPVASYTIAVTESTDNAVRWEIMMTGTPWGLTFGHKVAIEDNGWRMHTDQWCHMEPDPP